MRKCRSIAVEVTSVLGLVALIAWSASSSAQQAPGSSSNPPRDFDPPVANCNLTPDTNQAKVPPPGQPSATPITADLLTSGQPCHQVLSGRGLVPNNVLDNLQRGFDFYSWLTFIALNSPADGKTIGKGPRPGGDSLTKWEDVANYRPLANVMLRNGEKPKWGTRIVPDQCKSLDGPNKIVFTLGEEAFNQPFKSGPLIDQDGNYALFNILMNQPMFDFIVEHGLYNKQGQEKFNGEIVFPSGRNPGQIPTDTPGRMGAVMVKVSWRILDPDKNKDLISRFHTADALIFFPGPPATKAGPTCVAKKLGLIGFHVGHKTFNSPQWVWTSFEHVGNVPDQADVGSGKLLPRYSFYNRVCKNCPVNQTPQPPTPWDPDASLKFHSGYRSQVTRVNMLPPQVIAEVAELNRGFRAILKGTVWENYMLLATQWPSDARSTTDPTGAPAPTYLANTTLETYSQGRVPLASSSCMACHGNATTQHVPATPSDFTFILEKAQ
jgi:hypothetical protein